MKTFKTKPAINLKYLPYIICTAVIFALLFLPEHILKYLKTIFAVLSPLLFGLFLAFLSERPVCFFERTLFKKFKSRRTFSVVLFIFIIAAIITFSSFPIIRSLKNSASQIAQKLPFYSEQIVEFANRISASLGFKRNFSASTLLELAYSAIYPKANPTSTLSGFFTGISSFLLSAVFAVYMLIYKDRLIKEADRFCYAYFHHKAYFFICNFAMETNKVFSGYFSGKLLQCLLIGVSTFIPMQLLGIPFSVLISVIMCVLNIIAMIGPIIGAIICSGLLLLSSAQHTLSFLIITLATQFIFGQIIGPKLLGSYTGLNSFWVFFSLVAGAILGGIFGMIVGIPLFGVIYIFIRQSVNERIAQKDRCGFESSQKTVYNDIKNNSE